MRWSKTDNSPKVRLSEEERRGGVELTDRLLEDMLSTAKRKGTNVTLCDIMQRGLRAILRPSGGVSFHAGYTVEQGFGCRENPKAYLKIGEYPDMDISAARALVQTIKKLAASGVDPFAGLMETRIKELREQGTNWSPPTPFQPW